MENTGRPNRPASCPTCGCPRMFVRITDETILDTERVWACYKNGHEIGPTWLEPTTLALIEPDPKAEARHVARVVLIGVAVEATIAAILTLVVRIAMFLVILVR